VATLHFVKHGDLSFERIVAWGTNYHITRWQPLIWEDFRSLCHKLPMPHIILWVEKILEACLASY